MKLGVDIFSLRFNDWTVFEHLDYAQKIGLDVVHFSHLDPFDSLDDAYLTRVKAYSDDRGIDLEVGMGSICPTATTFSDEDGSAPEQLSQMLRIAAKLGSPAVRCYLGSNADRHTDLPLSAHMEATIETCRAVRPLAEELEVKIAIENHAGDMQGRELAALIQEAGPEYVGACIDSGNPLWVGESPYVTLDHLAPYVVMSHIRDTALWPHPDGAVAQWVAMGDGTIAIDSWANRYVKACPNTNFTLEIITSIPPKVLPYLDEDYWDGYPSVSAAEFARFLALVASGTPYTLPLMTASGDMPNEYLSALAIQQQQQLEKSVLYCRDVLHI